MKKIILSLFLMGSILPAFAQKYMTRTGKVTFFSSTPVENIEAFNNEASGVLDAATGKVGFAVPVKSFKFEKELMQEHFNESYMESNKFPKSEFRGRITNLSEVNFKKDGEYHIKANGKMTIHGVTRDISVPGTITVKGNTVTINSKFRVQTADYGIKIPSVVAGKIARDIEITVNTLLNQR